MTALFDADAYKIPVRAYRPSNGSEGLRFEYQFCARCIRDKAVREHGDYDNGCPIFAAALIFTPEEDDYPEEWIYSPRTGQPRCTAFEQDPDEDEYDGGPVPFPLPSDIFAAVIAAHGDEPVPPQLEPSAIREYLRDTQGTQHDPRWLNELGVDTVELGPGAPL